MTMPTGDTYMYFRRVRAELKRSGAIGITQLAKQAKVPIESLKRFPERYPAFFVKAARGLIVLTEEGDRRLGELEQEIQYGRSIDEIAQSVVDEVAENDTIKHLAMGGAIDGEPNVILSEDERIELRAQELLAERMKDLEKGGILEQMKAARKGREDRQPQVAGQPEPFALNRQPFWARDDRGGYYYNWFPYSDVPYSRHERAVPNVPGNGDYYDPDLPGVVFLDPFKIVNSRVEKQPEGTAYDPDPKWEKMWRSDRAHIQELRAETEANG